MSDILMNKLREIQEKEGYLSEFSLKELSNETNIPISRLYGLATFHTMFHIKKPGKNIIEICGSPSCFLNGGISLEEFLTKELEIDIGQTTKDKKFTLKKTSCIGCCDIAPAMLLNGKPIGKLTISKLKKIIKKCK
jgi:NADH-quinone oxidoreductase subunit E